MPYPFCPFCYEGEIVEDDEAENHFFCNRCLKDIKIRKKKHSFVKHL